LAIPTLRLFSGSCRSTSRRAGPSSADTLGHLLASA